MVPVACSRESGLVFVTRNRWKVRIAKEVIEKRYGITLICEEMNVIELQSDDPEYIARESARTAAHALKKPVMTCDAGIRILKLNGFPGPYSNYVQRTIGVNGLIRLITGLEDKSAIIYSIVAYCEPGAESKSFYSETRGHLTEKVRGNHGYFFDFIFVPEGSRKVLAEFSDAVRWKFWRGSFEKFAQWYTTARKD